MFRESQVYLFLPAACRCFKNQTYKPIHPGHRFGKDYKDPSIHHITMAPTKRHAATKGFFYFARGVQNLKITPLERG